jgi:hypothetical protein
LERLELNDFATTAPAIWQESVTEGKTANTNADKWVFRGHFRVDADNPDAPDSTSYISCWTPLDLIAGQFAPHNLTLEGSIYGLMPLAFVPRSGAELHDASQDNTDEERATYITTEESVQAQCIQASTKARAPCNYANMMDALHAASMVWTVLF